METAEQSLVRNQELESQMRDPHEGNTPAAWTAVIVMIIGAAIGAVGISIGHIPLFWVGVVVVGVGALVGRIMAMMGYGQFAKRS